MSRRRFGRRRGPQREHGAADEPPSGTSETAPSSSRGTDAVPSAGGVLSACPNTVAIPTKSVAPASRGASQAVGDGAQGLPATKSTPPATHDLPPFIHQYLRDYIAFADQKAGVVFTAAAALLALIKADQGLELDPFINGYWGMREIAGVVAVLFLAACCLFELRAVMPRLGSGRIDVLGRAQPAPTDPGVIFWDHILTDATPEAYATRVERLTDADARRAMLVHAHTLARIDRAKYSDLHRGMRLGLLGLIALTGFVVWPKASIPTTASAPGAPVTVPATTPVLPTSASTGPAPSSTGIYDSASPVGGLASDSLPSGATGLGVGGTAAGSDSAPSKPSAAAPGTPP
jgi:hypothetical protein